MKKLSLISLFVSIFSHVLYAQNSQKVTTGVFINSLYDLDFPGESFKVDMWIWCNYLDSSIKMNEMIEFPKTKEFNFSNQVTEKRGKYQWMTMRGTGEVIKKWNIKDFPFDRQELNIALGYSFDTSTFKVEADVLNSKIDPDFKLAGWNIDKVVFSWQKCLSGIQCGHFYFSFKFHDDLVEINYGTHHRIHDFMLCVFYQTHQYRSTLWIMCWRTFYGGWKQIHYGQHCSIYERDDIN